MVTFHFFYKCIIIEINLKGWIMKRIFLLSTLVLTQTIFATTLTIYNSNIALIHESHEFEIKKQDDTFVYENIPNTLINDSVNIHFPSSVSLYSQVYKKKNLTTHDLALKFLDKNVKLTNSAEVKLLSTTGNNAVVQNHNKELFTVKISDIIFPYLPKDLHSNNSLNFQIKATRTLKADIDISYLAQNISFTSDYILNINKNRADLQGWVDISNNSGKDFKNTTVNLIAGDINRARNHRKPIAYKSMAVAVDSAGAVTHKAVAGYHKYTLPFKVDLNSYEKRRVKLLEYKNIAIKNHYIAKMSNPTYLMGERTSSVSREIKIRGLNKALPTGNVRIYTKDDEELLLLGEQSLQNTAKNRPITLKVGKDFDTKVLQRVISRKDTNKRFNVTVAYELINHSNEDKILTLEVPFNKRDDSKIITSQKFHYTKGNMVTFTLTVKANSQESFKAKFISKRR